MAANNNDIKEYAGGWITERERTDVPSFLKLAYICIGLGTVGYLLMFMNGEVNHSDRGVLVQQFNRATSTADGFMYLVAGLAAAAFITGILFAFSKPHE